MATTPVSYTSKHYGIPTPRYIIPLVRINGIVREMPAGAVIPKEYLPKTEMRLDSCGNILHVNDASVDLSGIVPCLKFPIGTTDPTAPPSEGYIPFYFNAFTNALWVYLGGNGAAGWKKVVTN